MSIFSYLTPGAIGPVWPLMLLCAAYMLATSAFLLLARVRLLFRALALREYRFLQRLYDATEMFSTLAILLGMLGTCLGLLEVLPVLGASLRESGNADLLQQVLRPLRNVWASTVAGLLVGGLWGEIILFVLKPYTRPMLMPLSYEEPPEEPFSLEQPIPPAPSATVTEENLDDDWRQKDPQGMY
ncbi:MAG: hypothetical protein ONB44_24535 [candidate division KSB1 bacterium]|nr:hypothetical protein [candidate division KSB1 bacterium]MDZ7314403.1 hypothetical protein [candidate division KSB1 bacterium]